MPNEALARRLDEQFDRVMRDFDDVLAVANRIKSQMAADGLLRPADARQRETDRPTELAA